MDSRLSAIDSIESLVEEESDSPTEVDPRRTVLVESWIVPQQSQNVDDNEREPRQRDQIGRHAHRKQFDDHIVVKWLEDVLGSQRPIDSGILVLLQRRKLIVSEIDHDGDDEDRAYEQESVSGCCMLLVGRWKI